MRARAGGREAELTGALLNGAAKAGRASPPLQCAGNSGSRVATTIPCALVPSTVIGSCATSAG